MNDSDRKQVYELLIMEIICDDRKRAGSKRQGNMEVWTEETDESKLSDKDRFQGEILICVG